ncbi:MAG: hypothetical protein DMG78_27490 [Acidobacteria bacterium]|nr:MAG: hypothetical protein DMG78_27490 [Acidobacteriota bacterium]
MPQIETWSRLPLALRDHLVERMRDRNISVEHLNQLRLWIAGKPEVPEGPWFKDFGSFKLCGEGNIQRLFYLRVRLPLGASFDDKMLEDWGMIHPDQVVELRSTDSRGRRSPHDSLGYRKMDQFSAVRGFRSLRRP